VTADMRERIIVALDTTDAQEAYDLCGRLRGRVPRVKVGMTLYYSYGPQVVVDMRSMGFGVFVDLKLHDIPHQVRGAARALAMLGADMITVHASGGSRMVHEAVLGALEGGTESGIGAPKVLAVTVLTSMNAEEVASIGVPDTPLAQVERLALLARDAGAAGIVCSPQEATRMRELLGPSALIVTPGIRPEWAEAGDQARIATPSGAVASGASHLVIGRPITAAYDPAAALERIIAEG
jgi:orotidine-5'-phosphate decarboxylase